MDVLQKRKHALQPKEEQLRQALQDETVVQQSEPKLRSKFRVSLLYHHLIPKSCKKLLMFCLKGMLPESTKVPVERDQASKHRWRRDAAKQAVAYWLEIHKCRGHEYQSFSKVYRVSVVETLWTGTASKGSRGSSEHPGRFSCPLA